MIDNTNLGNLIRESKESKESKIITIIFLFSGDTPDCEYEICNLLNTKYIIKTNVILVDINQPQYKSKYLSKEYYDSKGIKKVDTYNFTPLDI